MNRIQMIPSVTMLLLLAAAPARSQEVCGEPDSDQVLSEYLAQYSTCVESRLGADTERGTLAAKTENDVKTTLSAQPNSTSPASGFGSRVRDSIEDFLPLFGFAVDSTSTSDDDRSISARFNPLRGARLGSLAFTVTATEPEPGEALLEQAEEGTKTRLKELAAAELDDL